MIELYEKIDLFNQKINQFKGTPNNYPSCMNYFVKGNDVIIELVKGFEKKDFRRFDSWALAFVSEAEEELGINIKNISFVVNHELEDFKYDFESFRRRISFINMNNSGLICKIILNNKNFELYDAKSLFDRPNYETIRSDIKDRNDTDKGDLLEKAFQAFLFGKDLGTEIRTNDRLAILGEHFYKSKGKNYGILREFPTGVFKDNIRENCRLTPTESVDIITLNKYGNLAVIELKLDDEQLEVMSQILDYALFFRCYFDKIKKIDVIKNTFGESIRKEEIFCYVVNNHFHPRFDRIMKFYSTKGKSYGFQLFKIILGYSTEF